MAARTFSSSCRSCRLLASREQSPCSGATRVQRQRPSASCAELYTCQPSWGPMVCANGHACQHADTSEPARAHPGQTARDALPCTQGVNFKDGCQERIHYSLERVDFTQAYSISITVIADSVGSHGIPPHRVQEQ